MSEYELQLIGLFIIYLITIINGFVVFPYLVEKSLEGMEYEFNRREDFRRHKN